MSRLENNKVEISCGSKASTTHFQNKFQSNYVLSFLLSN